MDSPVMRIGARTVAALRAAAIPVTAPGELLSEAQARHQYPGYRRVRQPTPRELRFATAFILTGFVVMIPAVYALQGHSTEPGTTEGIALAFLLGGCLGLAGAVAWETRGSSSSRT